MSYGKTPDQIAGFYRETTRRVSELPGVQKVCRQPSAFRGVTRGGFGPGLQFTAEGHTRNPGEEDERAHFRAVGPGYFATLWDPYCCGTRFQ